VGGATVGLYITDPAIPGIRPTIDVDRVVEVTKRTEYQLIERRLRELGFSHDINGPTCRFSKGALILDVMPTSKEILGFSNEWYPEGIIHSKIVTLPSGAKISIFTTPYFIASKIEAFKGRGGDDYLLSHDLEDIIAVLEGNDAVPDDISTAPDSVRKYIKSEFEVFLDSPDFRESIEGHIADRANSSSQAKLVLKRMQAVTQL
jgi:hypothetical protein